MGQVGSEVTPPKFRKTDCQLFREIISGIPREIVLGNKAVEQSWQIFKEVFHRMQEWMLTRNKKSSKESRRLAWLSREMLVKAKGQEGAGMESKDR